ncbi:cell division FtsZ family protein [Patescibacteria group bacterium]|nr:cell division FtsZ family protein [Patescibacteria group bacterium]
MAKKKPASSAGAPRRRKKKQRQKKAKQATPQKRRVSRVEPPEAVRKTKIRVIGIGGGGGSIVGEIAKSIGKVDFVSANTDLQAQKNLPRNVRGFVFGQEFTKGLGCGMDEKLGESAAKAEKDRIKKLVEGQDVCILVVSLGGGTGSGAAPVFAEAAKEAKCLTLGIFTMPFSFEGQKRREIADAALEKVVPLLNAYVLIPNENIFRIIDQKTPLRASFSAVNKRLAETLEGFIDTLSLPGLINIDFADFKTLLEGRGRLAYLNSVSMQGAPKAQLVLKEVLHNPLYDYGITGADRVVFNLTGDKTMKMQEVAEISKRISSFNIKARIIFGISFQPKYKDKLRIALFAIGCKEKEGTKEQERKKDAKVASAVPRRGGGKVTLKKPATKKQKKKTEEKKTPPPAPKNPRPQSGKVRRNALDLKKAQDRELKDLEKQERQWDIPSFLRNTRYQEDAS